jgi:hypothetical protein
MSKKNFSSGIDALFNDAKEQKKEEGVKRIGAMFNELTDLLKAEESTKKGRPKTSTKVVTKSTQEGTKEGEARATFIVREDLLEKVKLLAYWERVKIKDVLNDALAEHINRYEKKSGELKPIPKK